MANLIALASLGLAGSALAAHPGFNAARQVSSTNLTAASNITLSPVIVNNTDSTTDSLAPQTDITLYYGVNSTDYVNVTLTTDSSAILLESISSLTSVVCSTDAVSMTFDNVGDLDTAYSTWSAYDGLVLVTNHMGNCDPEFERGMFVTGGFTSYAANLTLVASAEKKSVADVATYMRANFTGIPGTSAASSSSQAKRDIVIDPSDVTVSQEWDLPSTKLYEYDPYIDVTADSGSVAVAVTLGGYLDFDIWSWSLQSLYVDVETSASADLVLELDIKAPYANNFSYTNAVGYYVVDVPGILTFGPELSFVVGAEVDVDAAIDIVLDIGAEIPNGTVHLDFVNGGTTAAGWVPTYHANLTLTEEAALEITPFLAVTVGLDFHILGGALDLSGGVTPSIHFPTSVTLDAEQDISATGKNVTVVQPGSGVACSNGVHVATDFDFAVDVFVTQFFEMTVYNVTVPLADLCYSWV